MYPSKTQILTVGSSIEAKLSADVTTSKLIRYLQSILKQLDFKRKEPIPIYIDNISALKNINNNISPTERTRYGFTILCYPRLRIASDIIMKHISSVLNPSADLTNPIGWVVHS